jgi:hypothetical protein
MVETFLDRQIICIIRGSAAIKDCASIKYVGTVDSDHLISVSEVIKRIEKGKDKYYVLEYESKAKVYVSIALRGDFKYIRTEVQDTPHDRLLKVGECAMTNRPSYFSASLPLFGIKDILDHKSKTAKKSST